MACYGFYYVIRSLRQAIDFAEIEGDFVPLRKWAREVERSGHELEEMDNRLNQSIGQDVLLTALQTVSSGALSPSNALLLISRWLIGGEVQAVETEPAKQVQSAGVVNGVAYARLICPIILPINLGMVTQRLA